MRQKQATINRLKTLNSNFLRDILDKDFKKMIILIMIMSACPGKQGTVYKNDCIHIQNIQNVLC